MENSDTSIVPEPKDVTPETIRDLLADLDSEDDEPLKAAVVVKPTPAAPDEIAPTPSSETEEALRPDEVLEVMSYETQVITSEIIADAVPSKAIDIGKYHERLDAVTDEILHGCRADRQEAQDVINMLRSAVDEARAASRDPSRMYVDGLVKAIEVKSNINSTAVKILEANAKMLAATKAGVLVQNNIQNNGIGFDGSLEKILGNGPPGEDDF